MKQVLTIEKATFNIRTQALLNFTPISFFFKHKDKKKGELIQQDYWGEDLHRMMGKNFITFVDTDKNLWELKISNFPKEYDKMTQIMEINPHFIPQQFNLLEAGLVNVGFSSVLTWAHGKYIMPRKMGERSNYQGS
ncbi:MAG: hypothetical protein U0457_04355 [Candidatus Sericytochromatia bacterium]